jgi:hypothetical protein
MKARPNARQQSRLPAPRKEEFPSLMQQALRKLANEWQHVDIIALSCQSLTTDEDLAKSLRSAVAVAAHYLGVDETIVVMPGEVFALYFVTYLDNFAILTAPIYSVRAPWEWSIFWHELAGYKVRRLTKDSEIIAIRKNLEFLHQTFTGANSGQRQKKFQADLLAAMTCNNPFDHHYLKICLTKDTPDLSDLGNFEHQIERMMEKLAADDLKNYERAMQQGWCSYWMKELFEDAWSVTAFGSEFLGTFEDILRRRGVRDDRHPPVEIRLAVARKLLELQRLAGHSRKQLDVAFDKRREQLQRRLAKKSNEKSKEKIRDELAAELAAQQTFKFISLLVPATLPFAEPDWDALIKARDYQRLWKKIQQRIKAGGEIKFTQLDQSSAFKIASKKFKTYMLEAMYKRAQFHSREGSVTAANDYADHLIKTILAKIEVIRDDSPERHPTPEYVDILKDKDFRELLQVAFYDVDFANEPGGGGGAGSNPPYGLADAALYALGMGPRP